MNELPNDTIRLFIHDCRVNLVIGIPEAERKEKQPVVVNLECEARLSRRYDDAAETSVAEIIDYGAFYDFIRHELPKQEPFGFLESAAEKIISFCFRDARIQKVRVRLEKTTVFPDASGAGVEMVRARP
jgi:dihydroneopterin aldolase